MEDKRFFVLVGNVVCLIYLTFSLTFNKMTCKPDSNAEHLPQNQVNK